MTPNKERKKILRTISPLPLLLVTVWSREGRNRCRRTDPRTYKLIEEYFARAQHHRRSPVTPSRGRIPCLPTPLACAKKKILNNITPTPTWEALDLQKSKAISYKRRQASYPTSIPLMRPLEESTRRLSMRRRERNGRRIWGVPDLLSSVFPRWNKRLVLVSRVPHQFAPSLRLYFLIQL